LCRGSARITTPPSGTDLAQAWAIKRRPIGSQAAVALDEELRKCLMRRKAREVLRLAQLQ
jgi:hypothetical protein